MRTGLVAAGGLALGPEFWRAALAAPAERGRSPYGPLGPPDANGVRLPDGFRSRVIARGGAQVPGTSYPWHIFSDGASTFATREGGWILVSNSELPTAPDLLPGVPLIGSPGDGGASAIRFGPDGEIRSAYRILSGTSTNCAGGATPWGTWLSCEEIPEGLVWECDPRGKRTAQPRPALGTFQHEAVCVDRRRGHVYLTEDVSDGGFYRFTSRRRGDLRAGKLEIAVVGRGGSVSWRRVPDRAARSAPTREQVAGATRFDRGEGIWYSRGFVYLATTGDSRIRAYDVRRQRLRLIYDPKRLESPPLTGVDNITVSRAGELFVCEDVLDGSDPFDIAIITPPPNRRVARFLKLTGQQQGFPGTDASSEIAGVCFNPRGDRMYFASQRESFTGVVYEVRGPFNGRRRRRR
jgi:secreted PhoX family phosphatase